MTTQERFGRAQSPLAKRAFGVRLVFHIVSIPFTTWGLYQAHVGTNEIILWLVLLSLAVAVGIQYAIGSQESTVARQLVWWAFPNAGSIGVFILSSLILSSLIWFNHQTSQVGRTEGIEHIIGEAEQKGTGHIDTSRAENLQASKAVFRSDSLTVTSTLSTEILSHRAKMNATLADVAAMRKKAKSVNASHPQWSAGIYSNAATKERNSRAEYEMAVSASRADAAQKITQFHESSRGEIARRDSLLVADLIVLRAANNRLRLQHNETKEIAQSSGYWIVILTSFGSFIICLLWEGYRRICGLEMEGAIYDPSEASRNPLRHFKGFINDHIEVIDSRAEKTRLSYKEAAKTKGAYQLPRSVVFARIVIVLAISYTVLANLDTPEVGASKAAMTQGEIGFIASLIMALVGTFWNDKWNGKATVAGTAKNTATPVPISAPHLTAPAPSLSPAVAPHISVSHVSGSPHVATATAPSLKPTPATAKPGKKATPATVRKGKKATLKEMGKIDRRIRQRCRRAWEYKRDGKIDQSLSAHNDYMEDKAFMEANGMTITERAEGRLTISES